MGVRSLRRLALANGARVAVCLALGFLCEGAANAQQQTGTPPVSSQQQMREAGPPRRIPRQQALTTAAVDGTVREQTSDSTTRPVVGARIQVRNLQTGMVNSTLASGDGVFRMLLLLPGTYEFR